MFDLFATDSSIFYLELAAMLTSSVLLFYAYGLKSPFKVQARLFFAMQLNIILASFFSVTFTVLQQYQGVSKWEQICIFAYYFIHNLLTPLFCFYIIVTNGLAAGRKKSFYFLFFAPIIFIELMVITNPWTQAYYYFDEFGVKQRGVMLIAAYLVAVYYFVWSIYQITRYHKAFPHSSMKSFVFFLILVACGILLQALIPNLKIEQLFESLGLLGVLLNIEGDTYCFDTTTGVFNRGAFFDENTRLINTDQKYYVINIHLLNMKFYSRVLDVKTSDGLLHDIAIWLEAYPLKKKVYHFGGGNFVIIPAVYDDRAVRDMIEYIKERLTADWVYSDLTASFANTSINVARIPKDFETIEEIFGMVEIAQDKETDTPTVHFEDLKEVKREMDVERALRSAIENHSFEVYYQPIWSMKQNRFTCAEALVRLTDPVLGSISPGEFIPIAEKNSLIAEIGNQVLEGVCYFVKDNNPEQYGVDYIEVNLSVYQLMSKNLLSVLNDLLWDHHIRNSYINLEVTESAAIGENELFFSKLNELVQSGFTFSLDDYGTGYSNLSRIMQIPFLNIKIDKSLLWDASSSRVSKIILEDTITTLHKLGLHIIMEGVETKDQVEYLDRLGCDYIQGYYFSKPVPGNEFIKLLQKPKE